MKPRTSSLTIASAGRRRFLMVSAAMAVAGAVGISGRPARAAGTLKVGTYGGYFKDSFDKHIYPDFTRETLNLRAPIETLTLLSRRSIRDGPGRRNFRRKL